MGCPSYVPSTPISIPLYYHVPADYAVSRLSCVFMGPSAANPVIHMYVHIGRRRRQWRDGWDVTRTQQRRGWNKRAVCMAWWWREYRFFPQPPLQLGIEEEDRTNATHQPPNRIARALPCSRNLMCVSSFQDDIQTSTRKCGSFMISHYFLNPFAKLRGGCCGRIEESKKAFVINFACYRAM